MYSHSDSRLKRSLLVSSYQTWYSVEGGKFRTEVKCWLARVIIIYREAAIHPRTARRIATARAWYQYHPPLIKVMLASGVSGRVAFKVKIRVAKAV